MIACLAGQLGLDTEDLRLHLLAELVTTAFSVSGRYWVHHDGHGRPRALLERYEATVKAIPASLDLSLLRTAPGTGWADYSHPNVSFDPEERNVNSPGNNQQSDDVCCLLQRTGARGGDRVGQLPSRSLARRTCWWLSRSR